MKAETAAACQRAAATDADVPCERCGRPDWWGWVWQYDGKCEECEDEQDDEEDE